MRLLYCFYFFLLCFGPSDINYIKNRSIEASTAPPVHTLILPGRSPPHHPDPDLDLEHGLNPQCRCTGRPLLVPRRLKMFEEKSFMLPLKVYVDACFRCDSVER